MAIAINYPSCKVIRTFISGCSKIRDPHGTLPRNVGILVKETTRPLAWLFLGWCFCDPKSTDIIGQPPSAGGLWKSTCQMLGFSWIFYLHMAIAGKSRFSIWNTSTQLVDFPASHAIFREGIFFIFPVPWNLAVVELSLPLREGLTLAAQVDFLWG